MKERRELEHQEREQLKQAGIEGYLTFLSEEGTVSLDGSYTVTQLRLIANALDRILAKFPAIEDDEWDDE